MTGVVPTPPAMFFPERVTAPLLVTPPFGPALPLSLVPFSRSPISALQPSAKGRAKSADAHAVRNRVHRRIVEILMLAVTRRLSNNARKPAAYPYLVVLEFST